MKHFKKFLCVVLTLLLIVPGGLAEDMALALNTEETGVSFEGDVSSVSANNDDGAAADEDAAFSISSVDSDVAEAGEMDLPADDGDVGALSVQADYTDAPSASTVTYCFIALDTLVASRTAAEGEEIAAPDAPAAPEGMVFAGWALEDGTAVFADDTPVIAHTDPIISEINVIAKFAEAEIPAAPAVFAPSDEDTGSEDGAGAAGDASVSDNTEPVEEPGEGSAPAAADETAPVAADETEPGADDDPEADADAGTDGNGEEGGDADQEDADAANDADAEKEGESAKDGEAVNNADAEKDAEEEGNENAGALEDDPAEGEPNGDDASGDDGDEASNEDGGEASGEDGNEDGSEDGDEASGEDGDEASGDAEAALQPIRVVFNITPADAVVTVKALDSEAGEAAEEQPDAQPADETPDRTSDNTDASITAQDDGSFALLPGAYTYTASAEGYKPAQDVPFSVAVDALTIDIALEAEAEVSDEESADGAVAEEAQEAQEAEEADGAEEYPPFDQSATCNGVVVAVKADAGTFPAGAALHVSRVLLYEQRQADAAVDEVRDENMTVASSYTFDIKVLDDAGNELQPADGHAVSVSFSVDTVADENLTTTVYHIEEDGGSYTAASLETVEYGDTASAETDGFSVYTVEFAYENKTYSMAGGGSQTLRWILDGLGFVGEVTEVTVSKPELFDAVRDEKGEWIIESKQPFSSEESMKVVIGGQEFTIAVTDYWEPVSYIDENGQEKQISEYSLVQSSNEPITWTGWYVLDDNITIPERITVSGEAHLILCPHKELWAEKGITVAAGNTLNIYAQSTSEGQDYKGVLYSGASEGGTSGTPAYCAGIGGEQGGACGTVNIIGGEIHATGGQYGAGIGGGWNGDGGTVTIGGMAQVTANGGQYGAGIGGGANSAGGNITISGGTVKANGTVGSAGIGGGNSGAGGTVAISGGTVEATGSGGAAGIGGGWKGDGGTVTIGGTAQVTANGGANGAGIGGGFQGAGGTVTIGGTAQVTANGGNGGAGIGGGKEGAGGTVTISGGAVTLQTNSTAQPIGHGSDGDSLSPGSLYLSRMHAFTSDLAGADPVKGPAVLNACRNNDNKYVRLERCTESYPCDYCNYGEGQYAYKDAQGNVFNLLADTAVTSIYNASYYWNSGWYVVEKDVTINDRVRVNGTVNLILCDSTDGEDVITLTAAQGITVDRGNTLNIYVGKKGEASSASDIQGNGELIAGTQGNTPDLRAGIGGEKGAGGTVNIYGGYVKASGGENGAGIGGAGGTVNIYGGEVLAIGGENGAGIGGGQGGDGGTVNIYGGKVTAQGGVKGAGIGGGQGGDGGTVTISGGTVIATGGENGAGIGGADAHAGGTVTISGGTVIATGGTGGAGIGSGSIDGIINIVTIGDKITISGGTVTANGGSGGAGIGGGSMVATFGDVSFDGAIEISGGTVTALGGENGAGIGIGSMVAASRDVSFDGAIEISGGTVTALGGENGAGIGIGSRQGAQGEFNFKGKINIYGGTVNATGGINGAGIGGGMDGDGGTIEISGGVVGAYSNGYGAGIGGGNGGAGGNITISGTANIAKAQGADGGAGIGGGNGGDGGTITVNGGTVDATGNGGAGIGGGDGGAGGNITISGKANVTTQGAGGGAGIGGGKGKPGGVITINGGTVNANGGTAVGGKSGGAGIGGGKDGSEGGTIKINGGNITASGGTSYGAGIGGGWNGAGGTIEISGGTVTANGGTYGGAGIGGGNGGAGGNITISGTANIAKAQGADGGAGIGGGNGGDGGTITVNGGTVDATGNGGAGKGGAGIGGGEDGDGGTITISGGKKVTATGGDDGAGIGGGRSGAGGNITISGGTVTANGGENGAGIGGGYQGAGGNITIEGTANITNAQGGTGGAGIGGGYQGDGGTITISGKANVTTQGGESGAGIGGGYKRAGGTIEISGGTVTATGNDGGAGIGSGNGGKNGSITINGGEVTATGGECGAGIGGGRYGQVESITIEGGTIEANGGKNAAGIGGGIAGKGDGYRVHGGTIKISDGTVNATGGEKGAGIGGGWEGAGGNITIEGGTVTAIGGTMSAGIGSGYLCQFGPSSVTISGGTVTATSNDGGVGIGAGMDSLKAGIALSYSATGGVPELPKITSSSYVGDVTMSGDFCEWLDAGHYGVVFDAENANVDLYKEAMASLTIVPCPAGAHRIDVQLLPGYGGGAPRNRAFAAMKTKTGKEIPVSKAFGSSSIALHLEAAPGCEIEYRPSRLTGSDGREIHLDRNDAFTMPDCDVSAYLTRWAWLQWAIDRAANAEGSPSITLTADVRAEKWEKALAVPKGRPVTIDLAGCSIDRNLNNAAENGGVIDVTGALTVKDDSQSRTGKITGGYTVGNGGGAYVHGGGALTLTGGAVTGNRAAQGGGVYVADGSFSVSGAPKVTGNTCNGAANNVYLPRGAVIDVAGGLESGATIGVTTASNPETDGAVTLTRGLNGRGAPTAFASDEGYNVAWSSDGQEAVLPAQETILPAKLKAYGKTSLRLSWNAVDGAEGYDVFFARCGSNTYRLAGTVTDRLSYRFRKLNRHTCYKAYVCTWRTVDGVKTYTGVESLRLHAVTGGYAHKITNPKKVTVKRKAVKLAPGGKVRMGAKVTGVRSGKKVLSHVNRLRYYSTNPTVATVDEKGRITAVSLGECTVYAVANNGIRKGTRVTVREKTVKKGKK